MIIKMLLEAQLYTCWMFTIGVRSHRSLVAISVGDVGDNAAGAADAARGVHTTAQQSTRASRAHDRAHCGESGAARRAAARGPALQRGRLAPCGAWSPLGHQRTPSQGTRGPQVCTIHSVWQIRTDSLIYIEVRVLMHSFIWSEIRMCLFMSA